MHLRPCATKELLGVADRRILLLTLLPDRRDVLAQRLPCPFGLPKSLLHGADTHPGSSQDSDQHGPLDLFEPVGAVTGPVIDLGRDEQLLAVVIAQCLRRKMAHFAELTD